MERTETPYYIQAYRRRGAGVYWLQVFERANVPLKCMTEEDAWRRMLELLAQGDGAVRAVQRGQAVLSACLNADGTASTWGPHGMRHFDLQRAA